MTASLGVAVILVGFTAAFIGSPKATTSPSAPAATATQPGSAGGTPPPPILVVAPPASAPSADPAAREFLVSLVKNGIDVSGRESALVVLAQRTCQRAVGPRELRQGLMGLLPEFDGRKAAIFADCAQMYCMEAGREPQ